MGEVIAGATPDGAIGARTVQLLNQWTAKGFFASYALAKIRRYSDICNRDRTQSKFLLGWVNRSLSLPLFRFGANHCMPHPQMCSEESGETEHRIERCIGGRPAYGTVTLSERAFNVEDGDRIPAEVGKR